MTLWGKIRVSLTELFAKKKHRYRPWKFRKFRVTAEFRALNKMYMYYVWKIKWKMLMTDTYRTFIDDGWYSWNFVYFPLRFYEWYVSRALFVFINVISYKAGVFNAFFWCGKINIIMESNVKVFERKIFIKLIRKFLFFFYNRSYIIFFEGILNIVKVQIFFLNRIQPAFLWEGRRFYWKLDDKRLYLFIHHYLIKF